MLTRKRLLAAKIEAVEGTAENLTASDGGLLVYDPKLTLPANWFERTYCRYTLTHPPAIHGTRPFQLSFRTELIGGFYADANPPPWGKYIRACGFNESFTFHYGSTYRLSTTEVPPSLTISLYEDGVVFTGKGCRGNVKFTGKIGEPVLMEFDFQGVLHSVIDGATLEGVTYSPYVPVSMVGYDAVHSLDGIEFALDVGSVNFHPVFTSFDLDMGNTVALRENANSETGLLSAMITGRDVKGTFDPELTTVAAYDWYGKWKDGTVTGVSPALLLYLFKQGPHWASISAPHIQYREITDAERNGISARSIGFAVVSPSGQSSDELTVETRNSAPE